MPDLKKIKTSNKEGTNNHSIFLKHVSIFVLKLKKMVT